MSDLTPGNPTIWCSQPWRIVARGVTNRDLTAVWGPASGDDLVYVVGNRGTVLKESGGEWRQLDHPASTDLQAIWGADRSHIYIGGQGWFPDADRVLTYDGKNWSAIVLPSKTSVHGIWGSSSDSVFFAGRVVWHYRNGELKRLPSNNTLNGWRAVWGTSESDVFFVSAHSYTVDSPSYIGHFDGKQLKAWRLTSLFSFGYHGWSTVWGSGTNDVYITGWHSAHFNGRTWKKLSVPGGVGIWGSGPDDIYIIVPQREGGEIRHFDGTTWKEVCLASERLWGIWGRRNSKIVVVGDRGVVLELPLR